MTKLVKIIHPGPVYIWSGRQAASFKAAEAPAGWDMLENFQGGLRKNPRRAIIRHILLKTRLFCGRRRPIGRRGHNGLTSNSMRMMERSMEFLWTKQAALLDNIANAETPNYKAKLVTFEESFQESLEAADQGRNKQTKKAMREAIEGASWSVRETGEVTRRDENGVNITEQMTEIIRNSYQMQYLYQSLNSDMNALRTAIGG